MSENSKNTSRPFAAVSENIENSVSIPAEMNLPSPTLVNENSENNENN